MKIVLLANTAWYAYNFRGNLIKHAIADGHRVIVATPRDEYSERLEQLGAEFISINIHPTGKNLLRELGTLLQLGILIHRLQPDIVWSFTIKCNLYGGIWCRISQIRQIANISGLGEMFDNVGITNKFICSFYRVALKSAHRIFFQNLDDQKEFLDRRIVDPALCVRIPGSGVDLQRFRPMRLYHADPQPFRFLMFGRIVPRKGYAIYLTAAEKLATSCTINVECLILGIQDTSRKESALLYKQVLEHDRRGIIHYLPPEDDIPAVINKADVVVLPSSYNEGVPRSLLEALACGKPVITTDWKGCRDTVDNGVNGFLIPCNNAEVLYDRMNLLVHLDAFELRKMGEASRKKAEKEFDENVIIDKYMRELV